MMQQERKAGGQQMNTTSKWLAALVLLSGNASVAIWPDRCVGGAKVYRSSSPR
jgi:hypothetical protein